MILHEYEIFSQGCSHRRKFNLIPIGDTHVGTRAFDRPRFLGYVKWIKDTPNTYWVGVGDYCECITPKDIRFDPDVIDPIYTEQKKYNDLWRDIYNRSLPIGFRALKDLPTIEARDFIDMVTPIADKCIGLSMGNHEWDIQNNYDKDILGYICQELKVRNLGWASLTRLKFYESRGHAIPVLMYVSHGYSMGRKKGGKINVLEDKASMFEADIFISGHSHDKIASTKELLTIPRRGKLRLKTKKKVFCVVPSFFKTYEEGIITYGERREFPPTAMGVIKITIEPFRRIRHGPSEVNMHVTQ
jgi:hypothetical protein